MVEAGPKERSPRILIVNFHSSCNAGDAALLEAAIDQLRAAFEKPRIVVSANYPFEPYIHGLDVEIVSSFGALIGLNKKPLWQQIPLAILGFAMSNFAAASLPAWKRTKKHVSSEWQRLLDAVQQADFVVDCPGNHFFTMGRFGWPFLISATSIVLAYLFRKPVYILPQSLGPLKRNWERILLKWLCDRARIVFVRELGSFRLADELGMKHERVRLVPDLAFSLASADREQALAILERLGYERNNRSIGVTAISRMTQSLDEEWFAPYYSSMAQALARMVQQYGTRVYFFPQVTGPTPREDDRVAARKILERMGIASDNVVIIEESLAPDLLKALYGLMDVFVATRMHSGIFALSMGVPTVFVGYLTKIRGMLESLRFQEWLIELDEITEEHLWEKLETLWLQRDSIRGKLLEIMPSIVEQTRQAGALIAEDYYFGKA